MSHWPLKTGRGGTLAASLVFSRAGAVGSARRVSGYERIAGLAEIAGEVEKQCGRGYEYYQKVIGSHLFIFCALERNPLR